MSENSKLTNSVEKLQHRKRQTLSPKLDVVFQALFGEVGSERITSNLLEAILQEKVEDIDLSKNIVLRRKYEHDKMGVLDVFAKINGTENCNIELQVSKQSELIERLLFYWARVYVREIHEGNQYGTLNRCIVILICDYSLEEMKKLEESEAFEGMKKDFENLPYHTEWKIIEKDFRKIVLTDKLELHIISLEKARKMREKDKQDKLLDWLKFLENPKSKEVLEKMEENEVLKEAGEKLDTLSDDIEMQMIADSRWMAIADEYARREAAMIEGREEGLEKGLAEGRAEGRKEGIVEGEKKAKLETAKKMLEKNIPLKTIVEITELTEEEIIKMSNNK